MNEACERIRQELVDQGKALTKADLAKVDRPATKDEPARKQLVELNSDDILEACGMIADDRVVSDLRKGNLPSYLRGKRVTIQVSCCLRLLEVAGQKAKSPEPAPEPGTPA